MMESVLCIEQVAALHPVLRSIASEPNMDVACPAYLALKNLKQKLAKYDDYKLSLNDVMICVEVRETEFE